MLINILILLIGLCSVQSQSNSCDIFTKDLKAARRITDQNQANNLELERQGFLISSSDLGFERSRQSICNYSRYWKDNIGRKANVLTNVARLMVDRDPASLSTFESNAPCFGAKPQQLKSHPKYRSISGYGNNLKNPHWGAAGTPFGRYTPRNYDDSVYSIAKSVTGNELPNARKLVQDVLNKATKYSRTANDPNEMILFFVLLVTHDVAFQVPVEPQNNCKEIRCCASGNKGVLSPNLQNSACIPIPIPGDDPFYKDAGVKCLNMVRAEIVSTPGRIQYGEILNKVTSFIDLSIIYGSEDAEAKKIRSLVGGRLNLGPKNTIPMDKNGKYTSVSNRLTSVVQGAIWPTIFSRHHNLLADGLKALNPGWNDEKLYQEARRINIAVLQRILLGGTVIETVFKKKVNESYSENFNPSTFIEFSSSAYRFLHYYVNTNMRLQTADNQTTEIPFTDTFGRMDLIEDKFEDVLRGALNTKANYGEYSEEIINKFAKNSNGVGLDVIAIDIQRGRDHGIASYLETRRQCGFIANFTTFDDLKAVLPQNHVDLLKNAYESVEDIDLYVGGVLESFYVLNDVFVGETFGCIIGETYRRLMGGDVYFYSSPTSPYPFTNDQLTAIKNFNFGNLLCAASSLPTIQKIWSLVENNVYNQRVPCAVFPKLDLTAWKE